MLPAILQSGTGGSAGGNKPDLVLGFADLGAGAVDTSTQGQALTPTFTRATEAAAKLSTGLWKLDVASGVARAQYVGDSTAVGAYGGYLAEPAATQLCLLPRDMTNAAWVAVNVTPLKNATGIDGVANSASTLTCTSNGGSILQTLVAAASSRAYSVFLRRVSGTGTITIQQLTTTLDVTASLNSSTYTRVTLVASELNAAYGIVMGSSGDVIEADCNQFEANAVTTPIPAAGTRNADVLSYPIASGSQGALYASGRAANNVLNGQTYATFSDGTDNERIVIGRTTTPTGRLLVTDGGASQAAVISGTISNETNFKIAGAWAVNDFAVSSDGATAVTDTSGTLPTTTVLNIGSSAIPGLWMYSTLTMVAYYSRRLPDMALQALTA